MSTDTTTQVQATRHFSVSPETVYDAWLMPGCARQWLFATPEGDMVRADIDPVVGGEFNFTDRRGQDDIEHLGNYTNLNRPKQLEFDFYVPKFSDERTHVAVRITPEPSGGCTVSLTHTGVLPDYVEKTRAGWAMILDRLAEVIGG